MSNSKQHRERRRLRAVRVARQERAQLIGAGKEVVPIPQDEFRDFVEKMTNHQRCLWARAKFPGKRDRDVERVSAFVTGKPKRKRERLPR